MVFQTSAEAEVQVTGNTLLPSTLFIVYLN